MRAGAPDLTAPMPVLACTGAFIKNDDVCICLYLCLFWSVFAVVLVCISACIGHGSVLDCIGIVLANVLEFVLARIEIIGIYLVCICTYNYFIHTKYQFNACQYVLVCIGMYFNTCQYFYDVFGMHCGIAVYIESVFASIII